jgi:hypothetical protein
LLAVSEGVEPSTFGSVDQRSNPVELTDLIEFVQHVIDDRLSIFETIVVQKNLDGGFTHVYRKQYDIFVIIRHQNLLMNWFE